MLDWWLVVVACLVTLLLLALSVYVVLIFVAENDRDTAWFAKAVCVLGFTLAALVVLMLPLDVANTASNTNSRFFVRIDGGGLNTRLMWQMVLLTTSVFVAVLVPFAMFFYEAFDPDKHCFSQLPPAIIFTIIIAVVFTGVSVVLWVIAGTAEIPYYSYHAWPQVWAPFDAPLQYRQQRSVDTLKLKVSLFVYMVAVLAAVGWVLFIVYGGIGLVTLPIDGVIDWVRRPKPMPLRDYTVRREQVAARAAALLQMGQQLDHDQRVRASNAVRRRVNAFHTEVLLLQREFLGVEQAYRDRGVGPIKAAAWIIGALAAAGLSLIWVVHIVVYNAAGLHPFLNRVLTGLDSAFALLGTATYGVLAFYLLLCAMKGCVKFGMRIVFFQIHPMRLGDTLMNSLLFNVGLVLLCAVTVTQFCAQSFDQYAANSTVDALLNVYVRRLRYLGVAIGYFQFALLGVALLSIGWVVICPRKKMSKADVQRERENYEGVM